MVKKLHKLFSMLFFTSKIIMRYNKVVVVVVIVLNTIQAILPFILIQVNGLLITKITDSKKDFTMIMNVFILLIVLTCFNILCNSLYNYVLTKYQYNLNLSIETEILNKSLKIKYHYFEESEVYNKLRRASTNSIDQPYVLFMTVMGLIRNIIQLVFVIILLTKSRIQYIEFLFIVSALIMIPNFKIVRCENKLQKSLAVLFRKKNYYRELVESLPWLKEIKIFQLGDFFKKRFLYEGNRINKEIIEYGKKRNLTESFSQLIIFGLSSIYQFICIKNTINGFYDVGQMSVYIQTISKINTIISETLNNVYNIYKISLFTEHLYEYLNLEEEIYNKGILIEEVKLPCKNKIAFKDVHFKYPTGNVDVLNGINFELNEGEILGIIGENGAGKSTIMSLLCRLYSIQRGTIIFNGVSIDSIKLEEWRRFLTITNQDFIKYDMTLMENITLGEEIDKKRLEEIVNSLEVNKIASKLENGYDTQLGVMFEDGIQISHGEWQKVALSRSLYKPGSILILDEPSSALDNEAETRLFQTIKKLIRNGDLMFAIFITHNHSNLKYADKVIKIKEGKALMYNYSEKNHIL